MDLPTAGFLSTCVITFGGLALKCVPSIPKAKNSNNGKCPAHADIEKRLTAGDERMDKIIENTKITQRLVIAIASHLDIPIGKLKDELQDVIEGGG